MPICLLPGYSSPGDSGGGVFNIDGQLVGIHMGDCHYQHSETGVELFVNAFTSLHPYRNWIYETLKAEEERLRIEAESERLKIKLERLRTIATLQRSISIFLSSCRLVYYVLPKKYSSSWMRLTASATLCSCLANFAAHYLKPI
jgi:hypothetical protein